MSESRRPIREAPTQRGNVMMDRILKTAKTMLKDQWLADISVSALATEAVIKRTSLLLQFPGGWPDIASSLADELLFNPFDQCVVAALDEGLTRNVVESAVQALDIFIDLGAKSGRLVANIRSQMFVWGDVNNDLFHLPAQDYNEEFAQLLVKKDQTVADDHRYAAEALINFSLDIAGGAGLYPWTTMERRELVRRNVEMTVAGLRNQAW